MIEETWSTFHLWSYSLHGMVTIWLIRYVTSRDRSFLFTFLYLTKIEQQIWYAFYIEYISKKLQKPCRAILVAYDNSYDKALVYVTDSQKWMTGLHTPIQDIWKVIRILCQVSSNVK